MNDAQSVSSLESSLYTILSGLPERTRTVLDLRYALRGGKPLSLRAVGRRLGLSREWIRHVETRALVELRRRRAEVAGGTEAVARALEVLGGAGQFESISAEVARHLPSSRYAIQGVVILLLRLDERFVQVQTGHGRVWALRSYPISQLPAMHARCIELLRGAQAGLSLDRTVAGVQEVLGLSAPGRSGIIAAIRTCPGVTVVDGEWCAYGPPRKQLLRLMGILRSAGHPLHLREITEIVNRGATTFTSPHTVYEFLRREGEVFARVGPATFALKEWTTKDRVA